MATPERPLPSRPAGVPRLNLSHLPTGDSDSPPSQQLQHAQSHSSGKAAATQETEEEMQVGVSVGEEWSGVVT
jgi:hypothetical protein